MLILWSRADHVPRNLIISLVGSVMEGVGNDTKIFGLDYPYEVDTN